MSRLDELPPDQRAALSVLLRQRKSYAEVASLLGIAEHAVHDRAHAALAVLAPHQARALTPARRAEIGDYILGQQAGVAERLRTRAYLAGEESARTWAQAVAGELAPLGVAEPADIPAAPLTAMPDVRSVATLASQARATDAGASWTPGPRVSHPGLPHSSRLAGAVLLAALVIAVVIAVLIISPGGGSHARSASSTGNTVAATTKTGPTRGPQLALHAPSPTSRSVGVVEVLTEGSKRAFYIDAEHLPATRHFFYAIWLYNSHTSAQPVSKSPAVGSNHKLAGGALLPANAGEFHEILLTRETKAHPTRPGHVVLRGAFSLGG
jgi:Sigma-70, region 4